MVVRGARVLTVLDRAEPAEAVATVGERIVAVGRDDEIQELIGPRTEVVDAGPFWRAEEYHQRYLEKRGEAACRIPGS